MKSFPRLTSESVEEVMTKGRALKSGSFLFKYLEKPEKAANNKVFFGFIASKKNFPSAVERNKARRRGRAALQRIFSSKNDMLLDKKDVYCAFLLNKESIAIDFNNFVNEIKQVLIKGGILIKL